MLRVFIAITVFCLLYWQIIGDRGFGGLMGIIVSPVVLAVGLLLNEIARTILNAKKGIHIADFIGIGLVLVIAYFLIPTIR